MKPPPDPADDEHLESLRLSARLRRTHAFHWGDPRFPEGSGKYIVCPVLEPHNVREALDRVSRGDRSSFRDDLEAIAEWRGVIRSEEDLHLPDHLPERREGEDNEEYEERRKDFWRRAGRKDRWLEHVRHVLSKVPAEERRPGLRGRPRRDPRIEIDQVREEILALPPAERPPFVARVLGIPVESLGRRSPTSDNTVRAVVHVRRYPHDRGLSADPNEPPKFDSGAESLRISELNHRRAGPAKSRPAFFTL